MSYRICESCKARYGSDSHSCSQLPRRTKNSVNPAWRAPILKNVACHWSGCLRTVLLERIGDRYRLEREWGSGIINHPICLYHRQLLRETFGLNYRMNGIKYALRDLDEELPRHGPLSRLVILDLVGHRCEECETALEHKGWPDLWIVDHRIPKKDGGPNTLRNLRALCRACDRTKTSKEQAEGGRIGGPKHGGCKLSPEHRRKISKGLIKYHATL